MQNTDKNYQIYRNLGVSDTSLYEFTLTFTEHDPDDYGKSFPTNYSAFYGELSGTKFIVIPRKKKSLIIDGFISDEGKEIVETLKKEYEKGNCKVSNARLHGFSLVVRHDYGDSGFLVLYGEHDKKNFIAELARGAFIETLSPTEVNHNKKKLEARFNPVSAEAIAKAVKEHWETAEKEVPNAEKSTAELSEEAEKDRFTAKEWDFQGEPGYMVSQFLNGRKTVEQFIPKSSYKFFCDAIGVQPEIISGQEDKTRKPHSAEHIHEREER